MPAEGDLAVSSTTHSRTKSDCLLSTLKLEMRPMIAISLKEPSWLGMLLHVDMQVKTWRDNNITNLADMRRGFAAVAFSRSTCM